MAQYGVGHLDRLDRIERLRQQLPGLALAGNAYRGIGVPDCIRSGRDAAHTTQQVLGILMWRQPPRLSRQESSPGQHAKSVWRLRLFQNKKGHQQELLMALPLSL